MATSYEERHHDADNHQQHHQHEKHTILHRVIPTPRCDYHSSNSHDRHSVLDIFSKSNSHSLGESLLQFDTDSPFSSPSPPPTSLCPSSSSCSPTSSTSSPASPNPSKLEMRFRIKCSKLGLLFPWILSLVIAGLTGACIREIQDYYDSSMLAKTLYRIPHSFHQPQSHPNANATSSSSSSSSSFSSSLNPSRVCILSTAPQWAPRLYPTEPKKDLDWEILESDEAQVVRDLNLSSKLSSPPSSNDSSVLNHIPSPFEADSASTESDYTSHSSKSRLISAYARLSRSYYCRRHGYSCVDGRSTIKDRPANFAKFANIQKLIKMDKCDFILWLDSDALIWESSIDLASYLDKYHHFDMLSMINSSSSTSSTSLPLLVIGTEPCPNHPNFQPRCLQTGTFLLRASEDGYKLAQDILNEPQAANRTSPWFDQWAINVRYYQDWSDQYKKRIVTLPPFSFQSYPLKLANVETHGHKGFDVGHPLVLHFPGAFCEDAAYKEDGRCVRGFTNYLIQSVLKEKVLEV